MGNVHVKYVLKGKVLSGEEVEKNKSSFHPKCLDSKQKIDAILKLRELPHDVTLYIDENFNLTYEVEKE